MCVSAGAGREAIKSIMPSQIMSGLIIIGSYPRLPPPPRGHWGCVVLNIRLCIIWMDIIVSRFFSFFFDNCFWFWDRPGLYRNFRNSLHSHFLSISLLARSVHPPPGAAILPAIDSYLTYSLIISLAFLWLVIILNITVWSTATGPPLHISSTNYHCPSAITVWVSE